MRTINIEKARIEIAAYHEMGVLVNQNHSDWAIIRKLVKKAHSGPGRKCSYKGICYSSVSECILHTGIRNLKLKADPDFKYLGEEDGKERKNDVRQID